MTKTLIPMIAALCFCMSAFAQEAERIDRGYSQTPKAAPEATEINAEPVLGDRVPTVLEPRVEAVETSYRAQLDAMLDTYHATDDPATREAIDEDMRELKVEWNIALAEAMLEITRENEDAAAEADLLETIEYLQNPPQRTPTQTVRRDPNTGEALEGESR